MMNGPDNSNQQRMPEDEWQAKTAFWLARTINPPVRPWQTFHVDLDSLRKLPKGTLGYELALFLDSHNFQLPQTGDWIQQTHDIWHVLTGLSPIAEEEFILQAFVRAQIFRPSSAIVVLVGLVTRQLSWTSLRRSLHLGRIAKQIIHWDIESDWATPLEDVREKLGIHRRGIIRQTKGMKKVKD
ncbi:MAG: Coq4 family protein [Cyanobacteria bacterium P01_F01_bin.150]